MKKIAVLVIGILCSLSGFSQTNTEHRKFSDTEKEIVRYRTLCQAAWDKNEATLALSYTDSVKLSIVGSYVDEHTFKTVDNKLVSFESINKPVFLITSATWCSPCMAEIPALNKVAAEFSDRVTFLVLFHDSVDTKLAKVVKKYDSMISVVPSERKEEDEHTLSISGFKHITGYPSNYSISTDRRITAYSQGATVASTYVNEKGEKVTVTKQQADEINYIRLKGEVEELIHKGN